MSYLDGLNHAQKDAVLSTSGPISVLAGAGSGKTRVLTTRIYHLIREGVLPEKILAVTFTNKAAREMRERIAALLGFSYEPGRRSRELPFVATFHGLGRELLETYGRAIGVPRYFSIFDRDDSERAVKEALKELAIDPKEVPPRAILGRISSAKGEGLTREAFQSRHAHESFRSRVAAQVWEKYDTVLAKEKALDFDDLITKPVQLLREHESARRDAQERWDYIHIDEYQDTNALQGELATMLAAKHRNLFVVGDIDQTIYTWRGATIDNLLTFDETYPDAKTIILEENYRSTKRIVEAGNRIIEKNKNRKEKKSVTQNAEGELIRIHAADTAEGEAAWIAQEAKRLVRAGEAPETMAVLFRTNFQSRALEEAFLHEGLPYRLLGTRFFDRKEVKDVLAWARLAVDPEREADKVRAVQAPSRGIGKVTLGKVLAGKYDTLKPAERAKVEAFDAVIASLSRTAEAAFPSAFVKTIIEKSGLEDALKKGGEDDAERLENIQELATFASRYDEMPGKDGISAFLADAALASDQDEMDRKKEARGVTLMTVHAAKGLEFDTVFVTGMEQGLFPHEGMEDEDRDQEEERRLFYVAVTRAKKRVYLTLARIRRIYGSDYVSEPSAFLSDLGDALAVYSESERDTLPSIYL
ncbi:MAG TPA: UvrD-helicase domain-containing protein [Candidatus Paceibacterota bacterium]|nr:UvrD-helicase domain-containing protein [Candidatus Paceibacterota bacterium]